MQKIKKIFLGFFNVQKKNNEVNKHKNKKKI